MIVLGNVLQRIFKRIMNLLFMLILPTIICFFILYTSVSDNKYSIGIADYDNTEFTNSFKAYMEKDCNVKTVSAEDDIKSLILNDGLECIFVIDKNYTASLIAGEDTDVKSYYQKGSNYASPIQAKASSYLLAAKTISDSANGNANTFYSRMEEFLNSKVKVKYLYSGDVSTDSADSTMTAFGYIAFCMVILMASSTSLVMEDKKQGVTERIYVTPLSRFSYYVQQMIAYLIISIIQLAVVILVLPFFTNVSFGSSVEDIFTVFVTCTIFSMACITMGIAINKCAKNRMVVTSITALIILPMLMLGGCFWPRDIMPDIFQKISNIMPTTWFLEAADIIIYGGKLAYLGKYIGILIGFSMLMLVISFAPKPSRE